MTMREKPFLEMDAGEQREFLAEQLADWIEAEFLSYGQARSFHRRVRILAASIGMPFSALMNVLNVDADAIVATRVGTGATR